MAETPIGIDRTTTAAWSVPGSCRVLLVAVLLTLPACRGISPLANRIDPGAEPFLVFVGEGAGSQTDLFAVSAGGGEVVRLTFTPDIEWAPAIDPSGVVVAFFRGDSAPAAGPARLVLMNLVSGAERTTVLPAALGRSRRIGWRPDGRLLYILGEHGIATTPAPPEPMALELLGASDDRTGAADSALAVLLGDPPFARVEPCASDAAPAAWCVVTAAGGREPLAGNLRDPFRWGGDSLGYFEEDRLMARPLAGGRARRVAWAGVPAHPRQPSYAGSPPAAR